MLSSSRKRANEQNTYTFIYKGIKYRPRHTYIDIDTNIHRDRHRQTKTDKDRLRQTQTDTDRHRQTQTDTVNHRQTQKQNHRL